ncbi:hypothetical protein MPSI1_002162 [Malassezia psittaci]|uniref:Uncharacterized protein n=1 Tax=Malassezia psittaci TaxID=1821823 RepID=A0AAF0JED7_9BASI|nr:hypothetical protein MPSI1_002162 [Malassezia psittaci]
MASLAQRTGPWQPVLEVSEQVIGVWCSDAPLAKTILAVATRNTLSIYTSQVSDRRLSFRQINSYLIGSAISALAFSPGSQYGEQDGVHKIEMVIAVGNDIQLVSDSDQGVAVTTVGKIPGTRVVLDIAWSSAPGYEQYLATACSDNSLQLWDLEPAQGGAPVYRTLMVKEPVQTVAFHPRLPKLLLVVDASGTGRFIDWFASFAPGSHKLQTAASFSEAKAVAANFTQGVQSLGQAAWQAQNPDLVGAVFGSRWSIWNVAADNSMAAQLQVSGKTGTHVQPGHGFFAFATTNSRLFSVANQTLSHAQLASTRSLANGLDLHSRATADSDSTIQIIDLAFPQSPRTIAVHNQTAQVPSGVDLDTTGTRQAGAPSVPCAYGIKGIAWLPHRVANYDVLLVAIGARIIAIPATS